MQLLIRKCDAGISSGLKMGSEGAKVDGSDVPGLDIHCVGWRLEDVELSQDLSCVRTE